jgi:formate hydrogenlyase subunit 3/multisubunit Na+/H+ antiporter MnhD subunit
MVTKFLLIEGLCPIFEVQVEWDLNQLGGYSKIYPKFIGILLTIPFVYACPGLLGYRFDIQILPFLLQELSSQPIFFAGIWIIISLIIVLQLIALLTIGTILNEVFFGKAKSAQKEVNPTLHSRFYYPATILIGYVLVLAIWTNFFNYYFTELLSTMFQQLFIS